MNSVLRTGLLAASFAVIFGGGVYFGAPPLYRLFCQVTGLGGTTQMKPGAIAPGAVAGEKMVIRFDANHLPNIPWDFAPEENRKEVSIGARQMAFFSATNLADKAVTGSASFNVSPASAGKYFTKVQCFCFTLQTLKPHEHVRMPVTYFVDPAILKDPEARQIQEITLSYTFSAVDAGQKRG